MVQIERRLAELAGNGYAINQEVEEALLLLSNSDKLFETATPRPKWELLSSIFPKKSFFPERTFEPPGKMK